MNRSLFFGLRLGAVLLMVSLITSHAAAQTNSRSRQPKAEAPSPLTGEYGPQLDAALKSIADGGDIETGLLALQHTVDDIIIRADAKELDLFTDAAAALRIMRFVKRTDTLEQAALMSFLIEHKEFARALTFTFNHQDDDVAGVLAMIDRYQAHCADTLDEFANLAAAICVVHDKPLSRRVNENQVLSPDALALYAYYMENEQHLNFPVRHMPAELLTFVVDSTASIDEMRWALGNYRNNREIGKLFFTIEYDYDHLEGKVKKVTAAGFNLPNIAKFGGVCADQAYFACAVGKAIGVPTTYTVGASGEVSHAWVGFLESNKRAAWWNFDSGRYDAYKGVRGVVVDPQTGNRMPDSTIALLAEYATAPQQNRYASIAMTDAAVRLLEIHDGAASIPFEPSDTERKTVRGATQEDALALLEQALRTCPGYAHAWFIVGSLAKDGRLSVEDKQKWATVLHRLCGEKYPDFYFAVVAPMIESVEDVEEQNRMWNAAFRTFQRRHDLAAAVRMEQAKMWQAKGESAKAGQCYEDVITRYANAGPFVISALDKAGKLLADMNKRDRIPALYEKAWTLTNKPNTNWAPEFYRQSNWYRIGSSYADALLQTGRVSEAEQVRQAIGAK